MSMAPQAIHSNLSRPHPTDSRLLQNLIKGEKSYIENLAGSSISGHAAASALAAWGTSEAPDIAKASQMLAEILASVADSQRTHVQAMEGYRSALKDVLDREQSIRSVVRDRDILVGRLIKASKKKVSKKDSGLSQEEKMEKVNAAQRELHACEQVLASEEAALVGVKRRTFKEALTMRMKTMGDAGAAMVDAAKEAILLLDEFDTHGPLLQATGGGQYESMYADDGVETGAYDNQALDSGYYGGHQHHDAQGNGDQYMQDSPAAGNGGNLVRDDQGRFHKNLQDGQALDPRNPQQFDVASVTPSQSASQVVNNDRSHVPLGQRYTSQFEDVEEQEGVPSDTDSETDYRRAFIEPRMRMPAPHEFGVAADTQDSFIPEGVGKSKGKARNGDVPGAAPPAPPRKDVESTVPMPPVPTAPVFDVNQARNFGQGQIAPRQDDDSDDEAPPHHSAAYNNASWGGNGPSYSMQRPSSHHRSNGSESGYGHQRKSSNSLLGKVGKLFKTDLRNQGSPERERSGHDARSSGRASQDTERKRMSLLRRNQPDSSDEEPDTRQVYRNVNQPKPLWESNPSSDVGMKGKLSRSSSSARILPGPKSSKQQEEAELERIRATVVGGGIANNAPQPVASSAASIQSGAGTLTKKKKKKRAVAGSEIGTSATRSAGTYSVSGDLSSLQKSDEAARPGLSRSSTMKSNSSKKKNRNSMVGTGLVGGNVFNPNAGKFATANWVNKPASQMTAYEAVLMAGVVPKSAAQKPTPPTPTATSAPTSPTAAPTGNTSSRPASIMSSAGKNPPLKSALKSPTLSRSNSSGSAKGLTSSPGKKAASSLAQPKSALRNDITQTMQAEPLPPPKMEPIPRAPAPVTSMPLPASEPKAPPIAQAPTPAKMQQEQLQQQEPQAAVVAPSVPAVEPTATEQESQNTSSLPVVEHQAEAPKSVLSIEEDKAFDGTGRLDVPVDGETSVPKEQESNFGTLEPLPQQSRVQMPKLDMPSSEPFSFDVDGVARGQAGRRGSNMSFASAAEDGVVTPGAEQTYKAFIQENGQSPTADRQVQADGITRMTDRKVKIEPSRVYGSGGPELSDTSSEEDTADQSAQRDSHAAGGAQTAAVVQASSALADPQHKPDPGLQSLSGGPAAAGTPAVAAIQASPAKPTNLTTLAVPNKAPSDNGSTVSHRKSVRIAPDAKLPPDTPTSENFETPRGNEYGGQDPMSVKGSQLSSRIAPPPAAPAKAAKEAGPVDLAAGRQSTGWASRIREDGDADSSDDDDDYSRARKAFGSATRGWGEATGSIKPKAKKGTDAASVRSRSSVKGTSKRNTIGSTFNGEQAKPSDANATPKPAAPVISMYSATAPGSVTMTGSVPTTMYSATAPASVISGGGGAPASSPGPAFSPAAESVKAPAPLTASNLSAVEGNNRPEMPPVPQAPAAAGGSSMSVPTAPPPAISSPSKKGLFSRFRRNK